jgi:hypothetical protein
VSSTLHASARNSLLLETANLISGKTKNPTIISATQVKISQSLNFWESLFHHILSQTLKTISQSVQIIQTNKTIITISNVSLFMICVSSCAATDSISCLFSLLIIHFESTIRDFFHRQVAKAFKLSSSSIQIFGTGNHLDIQRFSMML